MSHYTQRTLKLLRDLGWECQVVEKWQMHSKRRIDLFGIIDIVAMKEGAILGVQSTSYGQRKSHRIKMEKAPSSKTWVSANAHLWLVTWKKEKVKRGGKAFRYKSVIDRAIIQEGELDFF